MTAELNRRAAACMSKSHFHDNKGYFTLQDGTKKYFHPTTDRNAAHLLLEEVGRRGLMDEFSIAIFIDHTCPAFYDEPGKIDKSIYSIIWFIATAPLDLIVQAAVEVLENSPA